MDFPRLLFIILLPIKLVRLLTDPIVDGAIVVTRRLVAVPVTALGRQMLVKLKLSSVLNVADANVPEASNVSHEEDEPNTF